MSYTFTYKCTICGENFQAARRANFCSPTCRKRASRQREQLQKTYERAFEAVRSLAAHLDYQVFDDPMKQDAIKLLQKLDKDIAGILEPHTYQRHIYGSSNPDRLKVTRR